MSFHHSPRIVTNGLLMYLDAANPKSFPRGGSTWYDLSGNGYDATIREEGGTPFDGRKYWTEHYGGIFDFPRTNFTDVIELDGLAAQQTTTQYTLEFWARWYTNDSGGSRYYSDMSDGSNHNLVLNSQTVSTFISTGVSAISYSDNEVMHFGWIRDTDGGTSAGIKNGVRTAITVGSGFSIKEILLLAPPFQGYPPSAITTCHADGWMLNQEQDSLGGGFASGTQATWAGWMIVKLYDRALTDVEIKQNYDALKGRFGL